MCDEYGIELTEEHLEGVKQIANENGEVRIESSLNCIFYHIKVRKNDFICHIKQSNMFCMFERTDPESDLHWQNLAITAFKYFVKL